MLRYQRHPCKGRTLRMQTLKYILLYIRSRLTKFEIQFFSEEDKEWLQFSAALISWDELLRQVFVILPLPLSTVYTHAHILELKTIELNKMLSIHTGTEN